MTESEAVNLEASPSEDRHSKGKSILIVQIFVFVTRFEHAYFRMYSNNNFFFFFVNGNYGIFFD